MEQHPHEDHRRRRPRDRDSHTDLAYLIVAGLAVLLLVRFWQRNAQPAIVGFLQQLTWEDVATALTVLAVSLVAMLRTCWERGHEALLDCQGRGPGPGARRRVISPIMAHLTIASACSVLRS